VSYILNNYIKNSTDVLLFDLEVMFVKMYKYFYIYTVKISLLNDLCDTVEVEYKKMLTFLKTRFACS